VSCYFLDLALMMLPDLLRYMLITARAVRGWVAGGGGARRRKRAAVGGRALTD
jgi:hypothetical protein